MQKSSADTISFGEPLQLQNLEAFLSTAMALPQAALLGKGSV
ncbi:hypothetical protein [Halodesulfurarchaeum sp.]